MTNDLSIIKSQDLVLLTEGGMITVADQRALSLAAQAIPALQSASTAVGERRFAQTESILSIRNNTPVDRARDVLSSLNKIWSGASDEFHRLRTMAYDIKVRRAKMNAAKNKTVDIVDFDQREIAIAEAELAQAEVDALQTKVISGQGRLQGVITRAVSLSQEYSQLCLTAGVAAFTEEDFLKDEVGYLINTAFWHASKVFKNREMRVKDERYSADGPFKNLPPQALHVDLNTGVWFEALGISKAEVLAELKGLLAQKEAHDRARSVGGDIFKEDFFPFVETWLKQMVAKYTPAVTARVKQQGPDRLRRLQQIISPEAGDVGKGGPSNVKDLDRGSMFE